MIFWGISMATFEEHCEAARLEFGKPYEEIQLWLDEFHGKEPYFTRHRRLRHHEHGIREAVKIFGEHADAVARQHIVIDLMDEGWVEFDHFPQDEKDFVKMGLW